MKFSFGGKRVWVAGHRGMVGSALMRRLQQEDCAILTVSHRECDLTNQAKTQAWMRHVRPDAVIIAAAKVGGILANQTNPVDFLYQNLMIAANIIHCAYELKTKKLLFLGSSCIYPKLADQPMSEAALLTGALESTNEAYAIAKIAGVKLCSAYYQQYGADFISVMPPNLYGIHDNFHLEQSHVIPALMRKMHDAKASGAKTVNIWGSGKPQREFMYANDLADACVYVMQCYSDAEHINVGHGEEITIRGLAETIARIIGYTGKFEFDTSKPDGMPRKVMDSAKLASLGWRPRISLERGLTEVYRWYQENPVSDT